MLRAHSLLLMASTAWYHLHLIDLHPAFSSSLVDLLFEEWQSTSQECCHFGEVVENLGVGYEAGTQARYRVLASKIAFDYSRRQTYVGYEDMIELLKQWRGHGRRWRMTSWSVQGVLSP